MLPLFSFYRSMKALYRVIRHTGARKRSSTERPSGRQRTALQKISYRLAYAGSKDRGNNAFFCHRQQLRRQGLA